MDSGTITCAQSTNLWATYAGISRYPPSAYSSSGYRKEPSVFELHATVADSLCTPFAISIAPSWRWPILTQ